jgi:hypothetical protein
MADLNPAVSVMTLPFRQRCVAMMPITVGGRYMREEATAR